MLIKVIIINVKIVFILVKNVKALITIIVSNVLTLVTLLKMKTKNLDIVNVNLKIM